MQKLSRIFVVLGIVAAILLVGGFIGWLAGGTGSKNRSGAQAPEITEPSTANPVPVKPAHVTRPPGDPNAIPAATSEEPAPVMSETSTPDPKWEEKLDEILSAETDNTNKVQQLLALFPRVPDESKSEIAQHLSNLVGDEDYAELGGLLKNAALPDAVLDVLLADVLNRPNSVKLPELLAVAQTTNHPKADEAKDILALFLDEDFGTDWPKWQEKMTAWLKDNPD